MALTSPTRLRACANVINSGDGCKNEGRFSCTNCYLLTYCGKECQKSHWPIHKIICRSPLNKAGWRPGWERENRNPFMENPRHAQGLRNSVAEGVYLWGNVPAIDVLRLDQNEGVVYDRDVQLLFVASGDLRNIVQTLASIPETFARKIQITVNDREFAIVARNIALLLFAAVSLEDVDLQDRDFLWIAECLIHLWYSAFLPLNILSAFHHRVKPLVSEVCDRIKDKPPNHRLGKTWTFKRSGRIRVVLRAEQWFRLLSKLDDDGLSYTDAVRIRSAVTLAPERADFRDRWSFKEISPSTRVAKQRFREDGILLPFGRPHEDFTHPNPMLFSGTKTWLMKDKSDPLDGWPLWEVHRWPSLAKYDCHGKLFGYLRQRFAKFLLRLRGGGVEFEMYCMDAIELPGHLDSVKYDRIEVSNISDCFYLGIRNTLHEFMPFLKSPATNPHATLITLFLNAVIETVHWKGDKGVVLNQDRLLSYLPSPTDFRSLMIANSADALRLWDARTLVMDVERYFRDYVAKFEFDRLSAQFNAATKTSNTIVEPWPMQPKLKQGQEGSQEEFNVLLASNFSGLERYVEWRKTG